MTSPWKESPPPTSPSNAVCTPPPADDVRFIIFSSSLPPSLSPSLFSSLPISSSLSSSLPISLSSISPSLSLLLLLSVELQGCQMAYLNTNHYYTRTLTHTSSFLPLILFLLNKKEENTKRKWCNIFQINRMKIQQIILPTDSERLCAIRTRKASSTHRSCSCSRCCSCSSPPRSSPYSCSCSCSCSCSKGERSGRSNPSAC